jgi:hypothetical protein
LSSKPFKKKKSNIRVETYMENTIFCHALPGKATIVNCQLHASCLIFNYNFTIPFPPGEKEGGGGCESRERRKEKAAPIESMKQNN